MKQRALVSLFFVVHTEEGVLIIPPFYPGCSFHLDCSALFIEVREAQKSTEVLDVGGFPFAKETDGSTLVSLQAYFFGQLVL